MKIILLTSSLGAGGAERVASTLANAWSCKGHTAIIVPTYSGGGRSFYPLNADVQLAYLADLVPGAKRSPFGYFRRLMTLRKFIRRHQPDIVVSFLSNVNVAAILALAGSKLPLIICERSDPSMYPESCFWQLAMRLLYRFADMLTVQTDRVAEKSRIMFPGVKRIRSIANPLPDAIHSISWSPANGERKVLLAMGRLGPEKQFDLAIRAFAALAGRFPQWDFHLYGKGPMQEALDRQIRDMGLQGRVFLKGVTDAPWQVMAGADAFIMTSRFEGFPNVLLEAMGIGMPCAAFDCPSGPREITGNGQYACLVPLGDQDAMILALARLFGDDAFRHDMGAKARQSVLARYSLPVILDQWDRLFEEVRAHEG